MLLNKETKPNQTQPNQTKWKPAYKAFYQFLLGFFCYFFVIFQGFLSLLIWLVFFKIFLQSLDIFKDIKIFFSWKSTETFIFNI